MVAVLFVSTVHHSTNKVQQRLAGCDGVLESRILGQADRIYVQIEPHGRQELSRIPGIIGIREENR